MTPRERFHQTMQHGQPDRIPSWDEGLRDEVLERWRGEGLRPDADLAAMFGYDRRERLELSYSPRPGLARLPRTRQELDAVLDRFNADDPTRLPADWAARVERWRTRDHLLELPVHSGLLLTLGVHDWASLEPVLYLLADDPDLARRIMDAHAQLTATMLDRVLSEVEVDFASFSEPISGNNGPVISPATYRQIALESYRPILDTLRRHGVQTLVFITYANARRLLDDVLAAGFNCLWAIETEPQQMDYRTLRQRYGKSLRLIGGIDLDCLMLDDAAIEREIMTKVPPLLNQGGYIPLADGRVRPTVPFARYQHYRRLLARITGNSNR